MILDKKKNGGTNRTRLAPKRGKTPIYKGFIEI